MAVKNRKRTAMVAVLVFFVAVVGTGAVAGVAAQDATVSPGESIQDAVDNATEGDTIAVEAGTYAEDVEVNVEGLTLEGPNAGISGDGDRVGEATVEGQVVLSANSTRLDGFDVSPPPASTNQGAEAVRVSNTPDNVVVTNNVVRDFGEDGLPQWIGVDGINVFGGDATDAVENVEVTRNKVEGISGRDTQGGATGISIQGNVKNASVEDNDVSDIGVGETAWAFGIVVRATGNHNVDPREIGIAKNDVRNVTSNPATSTFGVGLGFEASNASRTTANNNNFETPELLVQNKDPDHTLDATLNWWGDEAGADEDHVLGNVDTVPWLDAPYPEGVPSVTVPKRTISRDEIEDAPPTREEARLDTGRGESDGESARGGGTRRRSRGR